MATRRTKGRHVTSGVRGRFERRHLVNGEPEQRENYKHYNEVRTHSALDKDAPLGRTGKDRDGIASGFAHA